MVSGGQGFAFSQGVFVMAVARLGLVEELEVGLLIREFRSAAAAGQG